MFIAYTTKNRQVFSCHDTRKNAVKAALDEVDCYADDIDPDFWSDDGITIQSRDGYRDYGVYVFNSLDEALAQIADMHIYMDDRLRVLANAIYRYEQSM